MGKNWKNFDSEEFYDKHRKIEKIRKEKRSVRGRTEDDWLVPPDYELEAGSHYGRVIEVHKKHIFVAEEVTKGEPDTNLLWLCTVAKRHFQRAHKERNFVVVGDRVVISPDIHQLDSENGTPLQKDLPRGVIQHAIPRETQIARRDPLRPDWEHIMLSNIDCIVIVASVLHPEVRWGLIDRYLTQAELVNLPAILVLNKIDLLDDPQIAKPEFAEKTKKRIKIYEKIGYEVIQISALHPKKYKKEVERIKEIFKGKIVGVSGHSGVGKSSIINLMDPEREQIVDENPEIFYKGRHTTTFNTLLRLGIGGYAIDTPGIRSFPVPSGDSITLSHCFREFREFNCKFRECTHTEEPGCGILMALHDGKISEERYRSYLGIYKGVSFREGEAATSDDEHELSKDMQARLQMTQQE